MEAVPISSGALVFPKAVLREHPLYRRERGLHRPWMLRGRIPPMVTLPLIAVLILMDSAFLRYSVRFPFDADLVFIAVFVFAVLREVRVGLRMIDLKTSGTYQDLYLSAWSPVETQAAFVMGNGFHPCEYSLLAVTVITAAILVPDTVAFVLILAVGFGLSILWGLGNRKESWKFNPARSLWMLEAKDMKDLLVKGLRDESWIWIIAIGNYFPHWWVLVLILIVWIYPIINQLDRDQKIRAMTTEQLNDYLGRFIRGEEAMKL